MNKYIGKPTIIPKMNYCILSCSKEWIGDVNKLVDCIQQWADKHDNIIYTCEKDICKITFSLLDDTFDNYRTYCSFTVLITKENKNTDRHCIEFNRLSDYGVIYSKYVTHLIEHIEKTFDVKLGEFVMKHDFPKSVIPIIEDDRSYDTLLSPSKKVTSDDNMIKFDLLKLQQPNIHQVLKVLVDIMDALQINEKYRKHFTKFKTSFNKQFEIISKWHKTLELACKEIMTN